MAAYMNRGRMILNFLYVPLACVLWFTETMLVLMWQDPVVAHYAGTYARICIPGIFFYANFNYLRRYML